MYLVFKFAHPLFTEASSEMVSMEGWMSRSHSYGREAVKKAEVCQMTRTGLKISGNRSYEVMSPPKRTSPARTSRLLKQRGIFLTEKREKRQKWQESLSKRVQVVLKNKEWSVKMVIPNIKCQACKNDTNSVFALYAVFSFMSEQVSIDYLIYF